MMNTLYDILGLPRNASDETIKAAFYRTAKACHPDINPGDPSAEPRLRQAIAAYKILKCPQDRAAYDLYLRDRRRESVRRFATPVLAGLASGSAVALVVWLSISPKQVASGPRQTLGIAEASGSEFSRQQLADASDASSVRWHRDGGANESAAAYGIATALSEPVSPLTTEWQRLERSGDLKAIWAFAIRNPDAPQSARARSKLIGLIDVAEDVPVLQVLRLVATDAIAERAHERLIRLGALAAAKADNAVADASSSNSLQASEDKTIKVANREEPTVQVSEDKTIKAALREEPATVWEDKTIKEADREEPALRATEGITGIKRKEPAAQTITRRSPIVEKRQARKPVRQAASENRAAACSGSCSVAGSALFGVGF